MKPLIIIIMIYVFIAQQLYKANDMSRGCSRQCARFFCWKLGL